ncbi:MAG TPA: TetR/AcrR family transcriptional regulator [Actinomycetota bacterium]|jgi:AcrR family transcriptional regulator|nr:TetR/AcrR family transcriptional regulator [Actinomycetota bacterium]
MAAERTRSSSRRDQIVAVAMHHFADEGYRGARIEDIASEVGVAKGTVFLHFGSKEGLFLAAYEEAVRQIPAWLDAPVEVLDRGFWAVLSYWLHRTEELVAEAWVPNRVAMIGRYDTGLGLRRPIDRLMRSEDPYGTLEFVEFGVERGEIRGDVDVEMIASVLDWAAERFQDALGSADLDPGLVHRKPFDPARRETRIEEFIQLLFGGIAAEGAAPPAPLGPQPKPPAPGEEAGA